MRCVMVSNLKQQHFISHISQTELSINYNFIFPHLLYLEHSHQRLFRAKIQLPLSYCNQLKMKPKISCKSKSKYYIVANMKNVRKFVTS